MSIKTTVEGSLHQAKGKINELVGKLTKDELREFKGDAEKLAGYVQKKYGLDFDEARKQADRLLAE